MPWTISRREEVDEYLLRRSFGVYAAIELFAGEGFWYNRIKRSKMELEVLQSPGFTLTVFPDAHSCEHVRT